MYVWLRFGNIKEKTHGDNGLNLQRFIISHKSNSEIV